MKKPFNKWAEMILTQSCGGNKILGVCIQEEVFYKK